MIAAALIAVSAYWLYPPGWSGGDLLQTAVLVAAFAASAVFAFQVGQLLVDEPVSELIGVLRGEPLSVRSKTRFLARLQHECSDGQLRERNRAFSLAVIAALRRDGGDGGTVETLTTRLDTTIARELPDLQHVVSGWSAFELDANTPKQMIAVARQRAGPLFAPEPPLELAA